MLRHNYTAVNLSENVTTGSRVAAIGTVSCRNREDSRVPMILTRLAWLAAIIAVWRKHRGKAAFVDEDKYIMPCCAATQDRLDPREWGGRFRFQRLMGVLTGDRSAGIRDKSSEKFSALWVVSRKHQAISLSRISQEHTTVPALSTIV